jgi:Ca2+-binding RTX toxin-like protein
MARIDINQAFPIVAHVGYNQQISLSNLVSEAFGTSFSVHQHAWLTWYGPDDAKAGTGQAFSFWDLSQKVYSSWSVNGQQIPDGDDGQTFVPISQFSGVTINGGTNIWPNLWLTIQTNNDNANPVYTWFNVTVVDPRFEHLEIRDRPITGADLVRTGHEFLKAYGPVKNEADCHSINADVAAATGATLPFDSFSTNPSENVEGGFWRIVHRGSDNPVQDWQSLTQAGDIVRVDWIDGPYHTFMVMAPPNPDGTILVMDNGAEGGTIGLRTVDFEPYAYANSITIYRLSADGLYLIPGSPAAEEIFGTIHNDLIKLMDGNDWARGGLGNDVIYGNLGAELIYGNQGNDTSFGGKGNDIIFGGQANDVIYGNFDDDIIYGNFFADSLFGGQGNDTIYGGQGNDVINGNLGNDRLFGNLDADIFVFGNNSGIDTIIGFSFSGGDRLSIGAQTYTTRDTPDGMAIDLSGGGTIMLNGVEPQDFSVAFFA